MATSAIWRSASTVNTRLPLSMESPSRTVSVSTRPTSSGATKMSSASTQPWYVGGCGLSQPASASAHAAAPRAAVGGAGTAAPQKNCLYFLGPPPLQTTGPLLRPRSWCAPEQHLQMGAHELAHVERLQPSEQAPPEHRHARG